jgi:hypothetical protein
LDPVDLMRDVLLRLQAALPLIRGWICDLHSTHSSRAVPLIAQGYSRLPLHFPISLLEATRNVPIAAVPFPPVAEYGLPEFVALAEMNMAGITFGDMYFFQPEHETESLHCHELVHVLQWRALGPDGFLLTYAIGILEHGYEASPLEQIAYDIAGHFDAYSLPATEVTAYVSRHAIEARDRAIETSARNGVRM